MTGGLDVSAHATATPVIMPKLGAYTDDILLAQWLVDEGQEVAAGQVVLELETEKTNAEVEADSAGFVHRLIGAGETVPIGTTVGLIAATRAAYDALSGGGAETEDDGEDGGNPFLGYIGGGGGATVAQVAGAAVPAPARRPQRPDGHRAAAARSSRRARAR